LDAVPRGQFATVDEDEKLRGVMDKLVATGNPVIVNSRAAELLGVIDASSAIRGLNTG
jgi:hypothetical protein